MGIFGAWLHCDVMVLCGDFLRRGRSKFGCGFFGCKEFRV